MWDIVQCSVVQAMRWKKDVLGSIKQKEIKRTEMNEQRTQLELKKKKKKIGKATTDNYSACFDAFVRSFIST